MCSFLVDSNSVHKKAQAVNRYVAAIYHKEHKDVLLNDKSLRHSVNRVQSKDHRI